MVVNSEQHPPLQQLCGKFGSLYKLYNIQFDIMSTVQRQHVTTSMSRVTHKL